MRVLMVVPALLLASCADLPTGSPAPPSAPAPSGEFAMLARIGDVRVRATESAGFGDTVVTIGKGGFILKVAFENAGLVAHSAVTDADYELRLAGDDSGAPLPSGVVYTPFDDFDGSIYWVAPGQRVEAWLGLWHKSAGHYDAGPYRLYIERQPHSWTEPTGSQVQ